MLVRTQASPHINFNFGKGGPLVFRELMPAR